MKVVVLFIVYINDVSLVIVWLSNTSLYFQTISNILDSKCITSRTFKQNNTVLLYKCIVYIMLSLKLAEWGGCKKVRTPCPNKHTTWSEVEVNIFRLSLDVNCDLIINQTEETTSSIRLLFREENMYAEFFWTKQEYCQRWI